MKLLKHWKSTNTFKQLNYLAEEDLPKLYSGARFLAYPSLFEGFGLPILESLSCGTPVITSNVSSMPEVVGRAGILVNPEILKNKISHGKAFIG